MLVLARKKHQTIHIGDDIVITVVEVRGGTVRLGVEAPRTIGLKRGELASTAAPQPLRPHEISP